jgi:hypothetical protein
VRDWAQEVIFCGCRLFHDVLEIEFLFSCTGLIFILFYLFFVQGQIERDECYKPILEELNRLFPDRSR